MKKNTEEGFVSNNRENIDSTIFRSIFENSLNGILYGNPINGDICDANPAAASMFGYSIDELIKLNRSDVFDVNHPSMIDALKSRSQDGKVKGELIGIRKNGDHFPVEFTSSVFVLDNGEQRTTTILNDITERKKAEEEINLFLNNTEETFLFIDREFKIVYFNKRFNDSYFLNYKKHATKGESIFNYAEPERKDAILLIFNKVLSGECHEDILEKTMPNGTTLFFRVLFKPSFDFLHQVNGIFISTIDITDQKVIENEMKLLLDNTEESFVLINRQLEIVCFNQIFFNQYKYLLNKEVKKGDSILDYSMPERRTSIANIYNSVLTGNTIEDIIEITDQNNITNYYSLVYKPAKKLNNEIFGIFLTAHDITLKTRAVNQNLFEQRNREALINTTSVLIWSVDKEFKLISANQAFIKTMQIVSNQDLKSGDDLLFEDHIDPDFIAFWKQMYIRGLAGEAFKFETQTPKKYTNVVYLETTINPIFEGDSIIGIACYSRDITELKNAHEELKTSNELFEKLTLKLPTAIFQFEIAVNGKMSFPYMSKGMSKLNPSLDLELLKSDAMSAFLTVHPDDVSPMKASIEHSKNTLTTWEFEYRSVIKKDEFIWMKAISNPEKKEDGTIVWYGYIQDVTEKRRIYQQLLQNEQDIKSSHEQLTKLTESVDTVVFQFEMTSDNKMSFPFISKSASNLIPGIDIELLKQDATAAFAFVHPDDINGLIKSIYESRDNLSDWSYEYRSIINDKNEIWIKGASRPELRENGTIAWYGYFLDITEKKMDHENLLNAYERYDIIAKATNDTIWDCDLINNRIYWAKGIFGYDFDSIDTSFDWWFDKIHPEDSDRVKQKLTLVIENQEPRWEDEFRFMAADGSYKYVYDRGYLVLHNSIPLRMIGAMQDITARKESEKELEKTSRLLNATSKLAKIGGWEIDLTNNTHYWSPEIYRIWEVFKDFVPTIEKVVSFIDLQHQTIIKNAIHDSIENGLNWDLEFKANTALGKPIWIRVQCSPFRMNDKTIKLIGTIQDITDRKNIEMQLHDVDLRFKTIIDTTPECIKLISKTKGILLINGAGLNMLELETSDILNERPLDSFVVPKYRNESNQLFANGFDGIAGSLEFELNTYKGNRIWVEATVVPIKESAENIDSILVVTKDITARKKEEHLLKLLESVITNTSDAVMITSFESSGMFGPKIVYVNDAFVKMTGYSKDEIDGKSPRILQGPNTERIELKKLSASMSNFMASEITIINYKKSGEEFWVNFSVSPLTDENGVYTHWIAVGRDVTQKKLDEIEREQIIAELSQNNKDLKQFSYVTSHNLRAPIANLLGLTSLIDQYKIPNKSLKQIIDGVRQSALMFDDTVKDLSKVLIIKDQTNIVKEEVSFVLVIENVLKQLSIAMDDNTVKINYEFSNAPSVLFIPSYMESILLNLFTNAIKYKSLKRNLKIDIISSNVDGFVILKFKDNGIGIDIEKYKDKLFKLYQRFHDNPDGKGLGLYLVKSQLEVLGGSIAVESEVGKGTTFIMKFRK